MNHNCALGAGILLALAHATPLAAQSINPALDRQQKSESRLSAAITIPLGASPDARRTAPRFEIIAATRIPDGTSPSPAANNNPHWQERRLGWTLDGSNHLMMNGRPLDMGPHRDGISTGAAVGIGLALVGVVALTALVLDDAKDTFVDALVPN